MKRFISMTLLMIFYIVFFNVVYSNDGISSVVIISSTVIVCSLNFIIQLLEDIKDMISKLDDYESK